MVTAPTVSNRRRTAAPTKSVSPPVTGTSPTPGRDELAGAIDLYRHLIRHGPVDIDRLPGAAGADDVRTLCALGLATARGRRLAPVAPTTAMAHVLAVRQQELAGWHDALRRAYRDLIRLDGTLRSRDPGGAAVRRTVSIREAELLSDQLRRTARRELLDVRGVPAALPAPAPVPTAPDAVAVEHRVILDRSVAHRPGGEQAVLALGGYASVRLVAGVTACVCVADREHVLMWPLRRGHEGGSTGAGATYVRSRAVAATMRGIFELLWSGSAEVSAAVRPSELTAAQWRILRLMTAGTSDAALAAASGTTIKTVRSHIAAILAVLGVPTRFAAGVEAARRGWL